MSDQRPKLPSWAVWAEGEKRPTILVDVGEVYPMYLKLTGQPKTNFGVGVARYCATRDLASVLDGMPAMVRFQPKDEDAKVAWSVAELPGTEEDYDRGLKQGSRFRKVVAENRAKAALVAE